jgi:DNA-binding protein Alba
VEKQITPPTVPVGRRPAINYVLAVLTEFQNGAREVIIKAWGRDINRALDVVQITKNRFLPNLQVKDIKLGIKQIKDGQNNRASNVITIEIVIGQ